MNLGRYNILEEVGSGGFGTVYKAEDQILGRVIALKVLHPSLVINTAFVDRFRREARLSAQLEHPNLVPVHDFSEIDGRFVISMSYMAGGSLKNLLAKKGKLAPERVRQILGDVCAGLGYAHAKGIIHRDLKPGNILLDEHGRARVGDLGFARVITDASSLSMSTSGGMVGTPAYMAPELWRNKPASVQTDIYSLGCIFYEMLTGKVLFEGTSPAEVMTMHVIDGPQFQQELPDGWRALIEKCVAMNPKERYPSTKVLLRDLDREVLEASTRTTEQNGQRPEQLERAGEVRNGGEDSAADEPPSRIPPRKKTDDGNLTDPADKKPEKRQWVIGAVIGALLLILGVLTAILLSTPRQTAAIPLPTDTLLAIIPQITIVTTSSTQTPSFPTKTATPPPTDTVEPSKTSIPTFTFTPQPTLGIGSTLIREKDGMTMVYVPAGEVMMGYSANLSWGSYGVDTRKTEMTGAYWIDETEVTVAMYKSCADKGICDINHVWKSDSEYDDYPVTNVTWDEANIYCQWAGGRLPSEAEWEKAGRGPNGNIYPWGNTPPGDYKYTRLVDSPSLLRPVKSYPLNVSIFGAREMTGNAQEWVDEVSPDNETEKMVKSVQLLWDSVDPLEYSKIWKIYPERFYHFLALFYYRPASQRSPIRGFRCVNDVNTD